MNPRCPKCGQFMQLKLKGRWVKDPTGKKECVGYARMWICKSCKIELKAGAHVIPKYQPKRYA